MKWIITALAIVFINVSYAAEIEGMKFNTVYDREAGFRVRLDTGETYLCLLTSEGFGFTKHVDKNEIAMTCAKMGVSEISWQFCIGGYEALSCVPSGTKVYDQSAAPRPKPDVEMGMGMLYSPKKY